VDAQRANKFHYQLGWICAGLSTKILQNSKTVKLKNEINQFVQANRDLFQQYLDRFKDILSQCPTIVEIRPVYVKLFMKVLTNRLGQWWNQCVKRDFFLRALMMLENS